MDLKCNKSMMIYDDREPVTLLKNRPALSVTETSCLRCFSSLRLRPRGSVTDVLWTEIRLSFPALSHSDGVSELSSSGQDWFLISASAGIGFKAGLHRRRFGSLARSCRSTGGGKVLRDRAAITWHWSVTVATDNRLLLRRRERICANETSQSRFRQQ